MAARLEDDSLGERTVEARGSPNRGADVSARRGGRLWRSEWSGGGQGGGGFGEYYWLVGRRAVESDLGGFLGVGGRIFARWAGGVWRMVGFSKCTVPRDSEEASRSAFRSREPCAGPNVCGVQCDRDRSAVSVPHFSF